jgi:hypothetical protein
VDPGVDLYCIRVLGGGAVQTTWPWIQAHLGLSPSERLDPVTEEHPQEVHPRQPLLPQLLKDLAHGMQLAKVPPSHPVPSRRQQSGVAISEYRERHRSVVPQVKPLLLPPLH